ncbi:MAG: hypothetical protein V1708_01395 [Candidatus Micrarchaeota archaeon]
MPRRIALLLLSFVALSCARPLAGCEAGTQEIHESGYFWLESDIVRGGECFIFNLGDVVLDCRGHAFNVTTGYYGYGAFFAGPNSTVVNCSFNMLPGSLEGGELLRFGNALAVYDSAFRVLTGSGIASASASGGLFLENNSFFGGGSASVRVYAYSVSSADNASVISRGNRLVNSIAKSAGASVSSENDVYSGASGIWADGSGSIKPLLSVSGGSFNTAEYSIRATNMQVQADGTSFHISGSDPNAVGVGLFSSDGVLANSRFSSDWADPAMRLPIYINAAGSDVRVRNSSFQNPWFSANGGVVTLEVPVEVLVKDSGSGQPVAGAELNISNYSFAEPLVSTATGAQGSSGVLWLPYLLHSGGVLPPGVDTPLTPHNFSASSNGKSQWKQVRIDSPALVTLELGAPNAPLSPDPTPAAPASTLGPSAPEQATPSVSASATPQPVAPTPLPTPSPTVALPNGGKPALEAESSSINWNALPFGSVSEQDKEEIVRRLRISANGPADEEAVLREYERIKRERAAQQANGVFSQFPRIAGLNSAYILLSFAGIAVILSLALYKSSRKSPPLGPSASALENLGELRKRMQ